MFPALSFANIHKYQLFPVPSDFVIVPPELNVAVKLLSAGAVALCNHLYFNVFIPLASFTVTVVLCDFL